MGDNSKSLTNLRKALEPQLGLLERMGEPTYIAQHMSAPSSD